jgi:hypothetical protein
MSNVLIGIIGVIFFIGLALAGASYAGALVLDGTAQANAAQITMSAQQTAMAAKLYRIRTRAYAPNSLTSVDTLITGRALKARPANPLVPANFPIVVGSAGGIAPADTTRATYALVFMGQSEQARDACIEIEIQSGHTDRIDPAVMEQQISLLSHANLLRPGCHRSNIGFGGNGGQAGDYVAYFPI